MGRTQRFTVTCVSAEPVPDHAGCTSYELEVGVLGLPRVITAEPHLFEPGKTYIFATSDQIAKVTRFLFEGGPSFDPRPFRKGAAPKRGRPSLGAGEFKRGDHPVGTVLPTPHVEHANAFGR